MEILPTYQYEIIVSIWTLKQLCVLKKTTELAPEAFLSLKQIFPPDFMTYFQIKIHHYSVNIMTVFS